MNIFTTLTQFKNDLPAFVIPLAIKCCILITIFVITRQLVRVTSQIILDMCNKNSLDHHTCLILNKITRCVIIVFATSIALQNIGIEMSMFMAAFGITGIVLSYGMKDIVANFIASILIIGYQTVKIDDYVKIKDWEGRVTDINLRYTTLQAESMTIYIPNLVLYTSTVAIISKRP